MIYALESTPREQSPRLVNCFEGPPDAIQWAAEQFQLLAGQRSGMQSALQYEAGYVTFKNDDRRVALVDLNPQGDINPSEVAEQLSGHLLGYSGIPSQQGSRVITVAQLLEPLPHGTADEYAAAELVNRAELIDALTQAGHPTIADQVRHDVHRLPVLIGRAYVNELTSAIAVITAHMIRAAAELAERREAAACPDDDPGAYQVLISDHPTGENYAVIVNADDRSGAFAAARAALRAIGCSDPRQLSAALIGDGAQTFKTGRPGDVRYVPAHQLAEHAD